MVLGRTPLGQNRGRKMLTNAHTNRRSAARIRAGFSVWVRNGNSTFEKTSLVNLSQGGASLNWNGTKLKDNVQLVVKSGAGDYLTFSAKTAWQNGSQVGLRFFDSCRRGKQFLELSVFSHLALSQCMSSVNRRCTVPRARLNRERTVPTGMSTISATSL